MKWFEHRGFILSLAIFISMSAGCPPQPPPPPPPTPAEILVECSQPAYSTWTTEQAMFLQEPKKLKVYQMNANRRADIPIIGTYRESFTGGIVPSAIEVRRGNRPWIVVDTNPDTVNRTFNGVLADQEVSSTFQWREDIQVRFVNAPQVMFTVQKVGVGIQMAGEGQSNWVGLMQTATFTQTGASTAILSTDPMDPNAIRPANDPLNGCWPTYFLAAGSMNPGLLDRIALSNNAPVMYIGGAVSGSRISDWQSGNPNMYEPYVHNLQNARAGQNCPALRLRHQAESEVDDPGTPEYDGYTTGEYMTAYLSYEDALQERMNCPAPIPIVLGVIGEVEKWGYFTFAGVEPIRAAQRLLPGERPQIFAGPETSDCPLSQQGNIHFLDDARSCLMDAFCASIDAIAGVTGVSCQ